MLPVDAIEQVEQQLTTLGYTVSQQPASIVARRDALHATLSLDTWERRITSISARALHDITLLLRITIPPVRQHGVSAARAALDATTPLLSLAPQGDQHELRLSGLAASPIDAETGTVDAQITLRFYE